MLKRVQHDAKPSGSTLHSPLSTIFVIISFITKENKREDCISVKLAKAAGIAGEFGVMF